jgi:hypothetical protein
MDLQDKPEALQLKEVAAPASLCNFLDFIEDKTFLFD